MALLLEQRFVYEIQYSKVLCVEMISWQTRDRDYRAVGRQR